MLEKDFGILPVRYIRPMLQIRTKRRASLDYSAVPNAPGLSQKEKGGVGMDPIDDVCTFDCSPVCSSPSTSTLDRGTSQSCFRIGCLVVFGHVLPRVRGIVWILVVAWQGR